MWTCEGLCLASALWERLVFLRVLFCSYITFENKRRVVGVFLRGRSGVRMSDKIAYSLKLQNPRRAEQDKDENEPRGT